MLFSLPGGIYCYPRDSRRRYATEEGTTEPRNVVLLHGDIKFTGIELVATGIQRRHRQMNDTLLVVQESVEVELFLIATGDIDFHILLAVHATQRRSGIEGSRTAGIVESHLLNPFWDIISEDKTTHRYDTIHGDIQFHLFLTDGYLITVQEGIGKALCIGKLDTRRVCHGRITTAAMPDNHNPIFPFV